MTYVLPDRPYPFTSVKSSFASAKRKGGKKSHRAFVPSGLQVETAMRRIRGYLEHHGMMVEAPDGVKIDNLARQLSGKLHNRGNCLGRHRDGEVATTTLAAMNMMLEQGDAVLCDGYFALTGPPRVRKHKQKYHNPRRRAA